MSVVAVYEEGDVGGAVSEGMPLPVGSTRLRGGGKAVSSPLAFVRLNFKEVIGGVPNTKTQFVTLIEDAGRPIICVTNWKMLYYEEQDKTREFSFAHRYFLYNDPEGDEPVDEFSRVSSCLEGFGFVVPANYPRKLMLVVHPIADDASAGKRCIPEDTTMILTLLLGE